MADEHDSWMQGLGVDIGQLRQAAQSVKNEALASVGVAPETLQKLDEAGRTIDDFNKGVGEGIMSGVGDLLELTPPVLIVKNAMLVGRVASADDPEEEFKKVVGEKVDSAVSVGTFAGKLVTDPVGTGSAIGEHLGKEFVKAHAEGHGAEFVGKGVGRGIVIAATVAVGAGEAEGAAVLAEAGEGAAVAAGEGGIVAAGEGGAVAAGEGGAVAAGEGGAIAAGEGGAVSAGEGGVVAASEDGAAALSEGGVESAGEGVPPSQELTSPPKTPPPAQPLPLRPTEFPKGPGFRPTEQPPGPAPDFAPNEPNRAARHGARKQAARVRT